MSTSRTMSSNADVFVGTWQLIRLILRRDRIRLPVWIVAIAGSMILTATSLTGLYPSATTRQARGELMTNPATVAMVGPGHGLDDYTYGAMLANERLAITGIAVALMSISLMVRHTRAEEEAGRTELLRASVLGRYASLSAALIVIIAANIVLGGLTTLGLGFSGVESIGWHGSLLFGMALASIGIVFAGITAVTAQLSEYGRGAFGMSGAILGVAYALRAVGDLGNGVVSWLSPFGWAQATEVFVSDRRWPLLISVVTTGVLAAAALVLSKHRDVGAGVIAPPPGPPVASRTLVQPFGFAFRLQRTGLIAWAIALPLFGILYGSLVGEAETFLEDSPTLADLFENAGASIIDSFVAMFTSIIALTATIFAIQATLRIRSEEVAGRADPVLSTSLARWKWATTHLVIALVGSAAITILSALGLGISAAIAIDDTSMIGKLLGAGVAYVPAIWCAIGIAIALIGAMPRATMVVWFVLVYAFVLEILGDLLDLPGWLSNLSPFGYVPNLPADDLSLVPLVLLTAVASGLVAIGLAAFQRRDIAVA